MRVVIFLILLMSAVSCKREPEKNYFLKDYELTGSTWYLWYTEIGNDTFWRFEGYHLEEFFIRDTYLTAPPDCSDPIGYYTLEVDEDTVAVFNVCNKNDFLDRKPFFNDGVIRQQEFISEEALVEELMKIHKHLLKEVIWSPYHYIHTKAEGGDTSDIAEEDKRLVIKYYDWWLR